MEVGITCQQCIYWDRDKQVVSKDDPGISASTCTLVKENSFAAPVTIGHHRHGNTDDGCSTYLITKSNFSCGASEASEGAIENYYTYGEDEEPEASSWLRKASKATTAMTLWAADLTIDYMLRRRKDERTIKPTKRITFHPRVKRELLNQQDRRCMYCGERKSTKTTDIDHKHPVVRGGENDRKNLQILCRPCNQRKGMQTDEEFRGRYGKLLPRFSPGQMLAPPQQPIPQKTFRELTKDTQLAATARQFKNTKYISPRQKISSGTPVAGAIVGGVFFFGAALATPAESWAGNLSLITGLLTGLGTWAGLMARAKYTGKFDM